MDTKPHPLIVILGPTASGKTRVAVELAKQVGGAIISADSRQVYRGMDIGTGKDLGEYGRVPYYLIDTLEPGTPYNVSQYRHDALAALHEIRQLGKQPILCGGTGLYIHTLLQGMPYSDVPVDDVLREELEALPKENVEERLSLTPLPPNFVADTSTRKRMIRALEIAEWYRANPEGKTVSQTVDALVFGIRIPVTQRREQITIRLAERLRSGLVEEVRGLLDRGIGPEQLIRYGLEYKYVTQYILGEFDYETMVARLNTEIHRFAKRQMTYFRKMEKDGVRIHWVDGGRVEETARQIRLFVSNGEVPL